MTLTLGSVVPLAMFMSQHEKWHFFKNCIFNAFLGLLTQQKHHNIFLHYLWWQWTKVLNVIVIVLVNSSHSSGLFHFYILVEDILGRFLLLTWPLWVSACCSFLFSPEPEMNYVNNIIVNLFIYLTFLHDGNILTG